MYYFKYKMTDRIARSGYFQIRSVLPVTAAALHGTSALVIYRDKLIFLQYLKIKKITGVTDSEVLR